MESPRRATPPQAEILSGGYLESGWNCILQMPTGSGKTWLAERAIESTLKRGYRAIYLSPLRALAGELHERWIKVFDPHPVGVFTGDFGRENSKYPVPFEKARLLVMTPEKLDACTRNWRSHWPWIPDVDLVVVDEFHLLGDRHRGARLEGTLLRFSRLNPFARFLGLSATLGNRGELADWMQAVEYSSDWRPVPLQWRVVRFRKATEKPDLLKEVLAPNVRNGGRSLVFVQSRRRAESLAEFLAEGGLRASHHHAGLDHPKRKLVEASLRDGNTQVLVATSTLEMGLNLPVRQVVVYDLQQFDGACFAPLTVTSVWQKVGRAGRPGMDDSGEAVLMAPAWERPPEYQAGRFEPVRSGLSDPRMLAEQVVAEVASRMCRTERQVKNTLQASLAASQGLLPPVGPTVTTMLDAGMLTEVQLSEKAPLQLKATKLGRIAVRHMLSPETVLTLKRCLETHELTFFDVLLSCASTQDCEPVLFLSFEELEDLSPAVSKEPSHLFKSPAAELRELLGVGSRRLLCAIKMALVARAWTRIGGPGEVADGFGCYPFEVRRLKESMERLLLAMGALVEKQSEEDAHTNQSEEPSTIERVELLQRMVAAGLDERAATLTLVKGIGAKWAKRLLAAEIHDIEDLASADAAELSPVKGLSEGRALKWITAARDLIKIRSAFAFDEYAWGRETPLRRTWPKEVDPYRLKRSLDLTVQPGESECWEVRGGLEPHRVWSEGPKLTCDCKDFSKGSRCKHLPAVQRSMGDGELESAVRRLTQPEESEYLDLQSLWFQGNTYPSRGAI